MNTDEKVFYWILLVTGLLILEAINMYNQSQCGTIEISCPYTPLISSGFLLVLLGVGIGLIIEEVF